MYYYNLEQAKPESATKKTSQTQAAAPMKDPIDVAIEDGKGDIAVRQLITNSFAYRRRYMTVKKEGRLLGVDQLLMELKFLTHPVWVRTINFGFDRLLTDWPVRPVRVVSLACRVH